MEPSDNRSEHKTTPVLRGIRGTTKETSVYLVCWMALIPEKLSAGRLLPLSNEMSTDRS